VVLLVLAGRNGLISGDTGTNETTMQTVTPADVPTDEPTPTPVPQLAPGLTTQGVVDGFALVNAHGAALDNTSYTVRRNSTTRFQNGTLFDQSTTRTQLAANESPVYQIENSSAIHIRGLGTLSEQIYSTRERTLVARTENGSTSYTVLQSGGEPIPVQYAASGFDRDRIELLFNTVKNACCRSNDVERNDALSRRGKPT
jgi:hypothetical protein